MSKTQVVATHLLSNCTNNKILTINDPFNKLKGLLTKSGSTFFVFNKQFKIETKHSFTLPQLAKSDNLFSSAIFQSHDQAFTAIIIVLKLIVIVFFFFFSV